MTSSNGDISAILAICEGNSPVACEFATQRRVTRSFDIIFDLRLNKRLSKQSWGWWLRRYRAHYDVTVMNTDTLILNQTSDIGEKSNRKTIKMKTVNIHGVYYI